MTQPASLLSSLRLWPDLPKYLLKYLGTCTYSSATVYFYFYFYLYFYPLPSAYLTVSIIVVQSTGRLPAQADQTIACFCLLICCQQHFTSAVFFFSFLIIILFQATRSQEQEHIQKKKTLSHRRPRILHPQACTE